MASDQTRPLGAQISHMLKDRGVDTIFGIPGVHNQEMYRGIEEAGITHVLARHEQGAGFMADGYARATGKPGVAYVITGPGLCNIMTPMGQAYSDSVPMLVISSCLDDTSIAGQLHQMKDQRGAADTVCDWSKEARSVPGAYTLIDQAFGEFIAQRKRPKHIQVPIPLLEGQAPAAPTTPKYGTVIQGATAHRQALAERVLQAQRPLFIFGGGAARGGQNAHHSRPAWVDAFLTLGAASFTTYAGRGLIPGDAPLHFGASLARPDSARVIGSADLVVAVGTSLDQVDLWRAHLGHSAALIRIDIDPTVLSDQHGAMLQVHADAGCAMQDLCDMCRETPQPTGWTRDEVQAFRSQARAEVDAERPGIVAVCDALRDCVPPDAMIYSDMTQLAYTAKEVWDMDRPGHWHHPSGFGTLGYATPAAIGGAVARKGQPTMAIIGDYGFHYTMAELGVAVELNLPLPIILWDNTKLKEIEDSMVRAQIAPNAVVARNPDFVKLAQAFGAQATAPTSLSQMQDAVRAAFAANGPTLIYLTPKITAQP